MTTLPQRINQVRAMRRQLDEARAIAPPDEWARMDARLAEIEADLAELVALARFTVEKFEKPEVWTREL